MRHFLKAITVLRVRKVTKYGWILAIFLGNRKSQDEFYLNKSEAYSNRLRKRTKFLEVYYSVLVKLQ
ncbi:hypothetical protein L3X37_06670 [Sabulilitoribacter arenilitoris]|uniref:Uncharacterized protein n=1 Tax=Wocania arenilitoris TaxID=2044858 RepID=A0AAE3ENF6_9FLAO|nr:hypothetical protein [Wocania arenilitoris]MCF7568047.1 hypothetical protein [Wocania arenilitoris]